MRAAITVLTVASICAFDCVMYAWADERSRRYRRRTITAQAALRRRVDRELQDLRVLLLDHLGIEEPTGWPEVEPEPITEPIVVQPRTEPMRLGDEIEADFRAARVQDAISREEHADVHLDAEISRVPEPVPDWQAEQDAWLRAQRTHLDELAS